MCRSMRLRSGGGEDLLGRRMDFDFEVKGEVVLDAGG